MAADVCTSLARRRQRNGAVRAGSCQACSAHCSCMKCEVHIPWLVTEGLAVCTLRTAARHVGSKAAAAIAVQTIGWSDMRQPHTETKAALRL